MSQSARKPKRAQSWDGDDLSTLSKSLQDILAAESGDSSSPSPSPPHSTGRKGRLIRSQSTREPNPMASPTNLTPIDEERPSPVTVPRLKRNVTFSHMPTNLFEQLDNPSDEAEEGLDVLRGGEAHQRLRAECGAQAQQPVSPDVSQSPLLKRRASSGASLRNAFPKTIFDTADLDDPFSQIDFGAANFATGRTGGARGGAPGAPPSMGWAPPPASATAGQMQQQWQQMQQQYMQQWMYWMQMQQMQQMQHAAASMQGGGNGQGVPPHPAMMMPPPPPAMFQPNPPPGMCQGAFDPASAFSGASSMGPYAARPPPRSMHQHPSRFDGYPSVDDERAAYGGFNGAPHHQQQHRGSRGRGRGRGGRDRGGRYGHRGGDDHYGRGGAGGSASSSTTRSSCALLEEHKVTGRWPTMEELSGHVAEFSSDAQGSRYVQHRMEAAQQEEKQLLIDEILPDVSDLADDGYGNYVVQNFLDHGSESQRSAIAKALAGSFQTLATQPHGCRVVQRLLELVAPRARMAVIDELLELPSSRQAGAKEDAEPEDAGAAEKEKARLSQTTALLVRFARHSSATHVLQKSALVLTNAIQGGKDGAVPEAEELGECRRQLEAMERAFANLGRVEMLQMACHPHSYRVVQKLLGNCDGKRSDAAALIVEIVEGAFDRLAFDQHGNFLLQHLLDAGSAEQAARVQSFVTANAHALCCHKFASHLVEKCLTTASATLDQKSNLVRALIEGKDAKADPAAKASEGDADESGEDHLLKLMQDPYANFVVQRAFDETRGSKVHEELSAEIRARSTVLSNFTFGRHILQHMNAPPGSTKSRDEGRGRSHRNNHRGGRGGGGRGRHRSPAGNNGNLRYLEVM